MPFESGPAQPVTTGGPSTPAVQGPAQPVYVVSGGPQIAGRARRVVVVTSGPVAGGPAQPIYDAGASALYTNDPPIPVYVVSGSIGGGGPSALSYLLRDEFTTDIAAGGLNGTAAEPGPGTRVVSDSGNKLSISSAKLTASGSTGSDNPRYSLTPSQARAAGLALLANLNFSNANQFGIGWGTTSTSFNAPRHGIITGGVGDPYSSALGNNAPLPLLAQFLTGQTYAVAIVLRTTGAFIVIDGKLEFIDGSGTNTPLFAGLASRSTAWAGTAASFRAVQLSSPWDTDYGIATNRVAAPTTGTTTTSTADGLVEFTWTAATGETLDLVVRRTDDNNCWIVRCDQAGSTIRTYEKNAGVETQRATTAQTWTNGSVYRILVAFSGNTIKNNVNDTAKNSYTSASFNNTATGVKVSGFATGSNLVAWPRTVTLPTV